MEYGFTVAWIAKGKKNYFTSKNIDEVIRKQQEMKKKHYKVSEVQQCIF